MNCKESSELIIERAAGRLGDDRAAELAEHVEGCNNCRFELEATQWLARKLHGHNKRIDAGHVSVYLLFKYVEDPEAFDEDGIEAIWEHLDVCDVCVDDYDYLKDLIAVPVEKRRAFASAIAESEESSAVARGDAEASHSEAESDDPSAEPGAPPVGSDVSAVESVTSSTEPADAVMSSDAEPAPAGATSARATIGEAEATQATIEEAEATQATIDAPDTTSSTSGQVRSSADAPSGIGATTSVEAPAPPKPSTAKSSSTKQHSSTPASRSPSSTSSSKRSSASRSQSKATSSKPSTRARRSDSRSRPKSSGPIGPVRDVLAGIAAAIVNQPRNAAIAGSGIVIGLIVVISLMNSAGVGSSTVAHWETSEVFSTTTPVQEVPISLVRRGRARPVSADVDLRGIGNLVIAVDLDLVDGAAMHYDAAIVDPQNNEVFRDEIGTEYFMEGRLLLRLGAKHFRSGEYGFVIDSTDRGGIVQTIARGTFYVQR